jgi:peptidoglycan LD-endopeptidase CwlK
MSRIDNITLQRIQTLHPSLRVEAEKEYREASALLTGNAILRYAYTLRTFAEQDSLYAQGRTVLFDKNGKRLGIVTNAAAGSSFHNYGLAWDIVLLVDTNGDGKFNAASWDVRTDFDKDGKSDWMEVTEYFKSKGAVWGGDFKSLKDAPHFEKTFGLTIAECRKRHAAKDFIPGTQYIRI